MHKAKTNKRIEGRVPDETRKRLPVGAFTMIELMVVVGIMGMIMTISVPMVWKMFHREPLRRAVSDVQEVCSNARAQAILKGVEVDVIFYPQQRRLEISGAAAGGHVVKAADPGAPAMPVEVGNRPGSGRSAQFADEVAIDIIGINLKDFTGEETAPLRFFANGTSDELMLILRQGNQQRGVTTEVTTGLADVLYEADLQKLRNRLR